MDNKDILAQALTAVFTELRELMEQERRTVIRKAQLRKSFDALYPLVFGETVEIKSLSLPDAIRLIVASAGRPLSAVDMKTKLEEMGYDLQKFDNPMQNILTAMKRMAESEELVYIPKDDGKKQVAPGPELKHVEPLPANAFEKTMEALGLSATPDSAETNSGKSKPKTLGERIAEGQGILGDKDRK
jgi:hypothetical protein